MQDSVTQKDTVYLFDALGMNVPRPWNPAVPSPDRYRERHGGGLADTEPSGRILTRHFAPERTWSEIAAGKDETEPDRLEAWRNDMKKIMEQYGIRELPFEPSRPASADSVEKLVIRGSFSLSQIV